MHSGAALSGFFLVNLSNPDTSIKIGMNILHIGYFFLKNVMMQRCQAHGPAGARQWLRPASPCRGWPTL